MDSVLLPSYRISSDTKYNKQFGFKAEHDNMKTIYFAADHEDSLNNWIVAMRMAANMQREFDGGLVVVFVCTLFYTNTHMTISEFGNDHDP